MLTIYALKLENNKYYIGKTHRGINADIRFQEHKAGKGSEWTKIYGPISIIETYEHDSAFEENVLTKKYMMKYGIENVRGGSYVKIILDDWQVKSLEHEFNSVNDGCFKCGKKGHFAEDCEKYNSDKYLTLFQTEDEIDAEIMRMTELRRNLRIKKCEIENLKYVNYTLNEGQINNANKVVTIEPKIIDEFKLRNYKYRRNSFQDNERELLYSKILQKMTGRFDLSNILQENVTENIYRIYIERIKLEKTFNKSLEENGLTEANYLEEINIRIECLYEIYCKISNST